MNRGGTCSRIAALFAVSGSGLLTGYAYGQAAASDVSGGNGNLLEVIVVTAQKRSENVQDVPIAISAFTAKTLQDKSIVDLHSLSNLVPNVNLDSGSPFSSSTSVLSASIRGIGQDDFAMNLDPGVGVYVDGVYFARTVGANQNLLDVDRVEILKGPQGTLFGRNTIGGAISVVTHTPGDQFSFQGQVTGGSFERHDMAATVDIPFSEKLLSTFTVASSVRNGYQRRIPYPGGIGINIPIQQFPESGYQTTSDAMGGQNQQVIRSKFLLKASDNLKLTLTADWTHEDQPSTPNTILRTYENSTSSLVGLYNGCVTGAIPASVPYCGPVGPTTAPAAGGGFVTAGPALSSLKTPFTFALVNTGNIDTSYATGLNFSKMDSYGAALTADLSMTDDLTLKSITAARRLNWKAGQDGDGSQLNTVEESFAEGQHQVSQEVQLIGKALGGRLDYVAGLYAFNEGGYIHDYVVFPVLIIDGNNVLDTTAYATFAHINYKVTDKFGITLGTRYSIEQKKFEGGNSDLNAFAYKISGLYPVTAANAAALGFPNPAQPLRLFPTGENHQTFHVNTPTAGADYHVTDDVMTYVSYSEGFKSGGWTTRVTAPISNANQATFAPETARTYEIGMKSALFDHRMTLNVAGFLTKYKGIQLTFQQGASPTIKNAGDADIKGVEVEMQTRIGYGFALNAAAGYMKAYYTRLNDVSGPSNPVTGASTTLPLSASLPKTPKFKVSISPEYDINLPGDSTLRFLVDWTHTASMFNDAQNTVALERPAVSVVDTSMHLISPGDKYELSLGGVNIFDKRFITTGLDQVTGGVLQATYNPPAEWYLSGRVKFR
ncbi:MAG: TonB-dependent receptor [Pseudomonadota bacterium]|nr:TonB-dependent receptor [Pseudomonadota bacterium]